MFQFSILFHVRGFVHWRRGPEEILKNKLVSSVHPLPATQNNINHHCPVANSNIYTQFISYCTSSKTSQVNLNAFSFLLDCSYIDSICSLLLAHYNYLILLPLSSSLSSLLLLVVVIVVVLWGKSTNLVSLQCDLGSIPAVVGFLTHSARFFTVYSDFQFSPISNLTHYCAFPKHANSEVQIQLTIVFFTAVNHLNGPLRRQNFTLTGSKGQGLWFVIGGFRSVLCVSVFQGSLLVIIILLSICIRDFEAVQKTWSLVHVLPQVFKLDNTLLLNSSKPTLLNSNFTRNSLTLSNDFHWAPKCDWVNKLNWYCGLHREATYFCLESVWELDLSPSLFHCLFGSFEGCFAVLPVPSRHCVAPYLTCSQIKMAAKIFHARMLWALEIKNLWFFLNTL